MESARVENDFGGVLPPLVFDSLDMILDTASRVIGVGLRCDIGVTLKKIALHRAEQIRSFKPRPMCRGTAP